MLQILLSPSHHTKFPSHPFVVLSNANGSRIKNSSNLRSQYSMKFSFMLIDVCRFYCLPFFSPKRKFSCRKNRLETLNDSRKIFTVFIVDLFLSLLPSWHWNMGELGEVERDHQLTSRWNLKNFRFTLFNSALSALLSALRAEMVFWFPHFSLKHFTLTAF